MKVLVIDDSVLVRDLLSLELTEAGHTVFLAEDGKEGVAKSGQVAPDVVLCDLNMPVLDGMGFVRVMHQAAPLVPVVIFTDQDDVQQAVEAMNAGAVSYLVKGASAQALNRELNRAYDRRHVLERSREHEEANRRHQAELEATLKAKTAEISRLEQGRAQSDKVLALGSIAAGIAHEINNPVAVVTSNVQWMASALAQGLERIARVAARTDLDPAGLGEELAKILDAAFLEELDELPEMLRDTGDGCRRITDLVGNLRRLARTEPGSNRCDAGPVLSTVTAQLAARFAGRAEVRLVGDPANLRIPLSLADATSVVSNLLENALYAVEPGHGQVTVTAERLSSGGVCLEVRDNGCGIPPENLSRVSEPFFTTRPPGKGTGLGLCLVTHLVRAVGGDIRLESQVGVGTTVTVSLPASHDRAASASTGRYEPVARPSFVTAA